MSKKVIYIRSIVALVVTCWVLCATQIVVNAQTVYEAEPNDTMETAQLIQANKETAAQAIAGSTADEYVVRGSVSSTDDDWLKVYLDAGTQYVSCNGDNFSFDVYNSNNSLIMSQDFTKTSYGVRAYEFTADTAGYYYVRIYANTSLTRQYIVLVGGPTYAVASCTVRLNKVDMTSNRDRTESCDLTEKTELPDRAIVYAIRVNGVSSTSVDGISVRNDTTGNTINLNNYTWSKDGLVSLAMSLRAPWRITFEYHKNTSFTPSVYFSYVYPVVSEYFNDDITITP